MSVKTALGAALAAAVLAALPAAPASANVQVGASGWQWGNPLPQGNTVRAISFAGATGYAAGDFGTLLKTGDGGSTWTGLPVGTFQGLTVVQALDANVVFAGGGCVARRSIDGGATFTAVRFTPVESSCRNQLRDLAFVSSDTGYLLLQDGSVFATTDGGTQFAPRTAVPDTGASGGSTAPSSIAFLNARTGYVTSGTRVFQTLDGAVSWREVARADAPLGKVAFVDGQHGFAVGVGGAFLRTDDGGATWAPHAVAPGGQSLTSIACNTSRVCIVTTASGSELIRTTDYGDAPGALVTPSSDRVYAAGFASPQRVAALGERGTTVVSDDAGVTFAPVGGRIAGSFSSLRAGGAPGTAYAPGADGKLAKTTDWGHTWSTGNVPTTADLLDASFAGAATGYALDLDGGLFRTDNAGATWKTLGTGTTRRPRALLAPDASTVLVAGPRGIRGSADAGETFDQVRSGAILRARLDHLARAHAGGAIFAWGPATLARSTDRGRTWTTLPRPGRGIQIAQVAFANARAGLLLDVRGRVWQTTGAGRRWTPVTSVGTSEVTGMAVDSPSTATLVIGSFGTASGGYLLRSDDAGETWQPQFVVSDPIRGGGIAAGDHVDYLLAGDARLLFSTTGGVAGDPSELTLSTRHRRLPRAGGLTVTGRLRPAAGSAQVVVSMLSPGASAWRHKTVAVASNGTFATAWRLPRGTTTFVAQWTGDFASAGAGSRPLTVTVAPGRSPSPRRR